MFGLLGGCVEGETGFLNNCTQCLGNGYMFPFMCVCTSIDEPVPGPVG